MSSAPDEPIRLTDVEASLLCALARRPGEILSREELIRLTGARGGQEEGLVCNEHSREFGLINKSFRIALSAWMSTR